MAAGGLKILENSFERLPQSEKKIAEFILGNPQEFVNSTVSQLSSAAETSDAAVIRLCKSLGLKGYQDLKIRVAGDLAKTEQQGYRDIEPNETIYSIVEKMTSNSLQIIRDTSEMVNYEVLEEAISLLSKAKSIHFCGVGASAIVAADAQQKFLRVKKTATAFTDMHLVATLIANADPEDVVFGVSFSGETNEILNIISLAKERGVKTIGLTHYGQSSLSNLCDVSLFTSYSNEAPFRSAATSSRLAQLHIVDILFLAMAARNYEETVEYIDKSRNAIKKMKKKK
ncbi:MurR/RpiR family transcriptional regulator [Metabacillus sp. GX 13764]|uniref:MurR/RpiR family transcriptional regulator n=1 Tax=Metabacillus kandeliae TaxID=2900151 RepID=UPI001E3C7AAA|nr:MurR/RpiR family transcriptional regulator [Metabacillus kandeliae]MCD7034799.1 MurR/RpiR family transcriptional regulator [Metabacillus kandeliae]